MLLTLLLSAALASGASAAAAEAAPFPFDPAQLAGSWIDSVSTSPACEVDRARFRMQLSDDNKQLTMFSDRTWNTALGVTNRFSATVVAATRNTLTIRYHNEARRTKDGKLAEWELAIVAPGVFRWREADWMQGKVNSVVGIRCAP
ncbi:hypothetical protein [Janthinobacterium agaricidamnosum]|uniref:Lipoprotein n=1 Tax=Janthinobacterium agaricidamnosum NBRC 102515 = DSM 9628 TaxID=1349767 RepID=W0V4I9_9BURK|nr:hypothetical protein [Janthinobacterium agaricidamnosum]CDG82187.1 hypothetical protein GJA_1542 [Janthinobacterium agaricidamnosum NBRC 102515 = DSM 9628]